MQAQEHKQGSQGQELEAWYQEKIAPALPRMIREQLMIEPNPDHRYPPKSLINLDTIDPAMLEMVLRREKLWQHGLASINPIAQALKTVPGIGPRYARLIARQIYQGMANEGTAPDELFEHELDVLCESMSSFASLIGRGAVSKQALLAAKVWWLEQLEAEL